MPNLSWNLQPASDKITMRYPEFLKENGKIGFIAPSFGIAIEPYITRFAAAKEKFEKMGYCPVTGPNVYKSDGTGKSSSAENCAAEINDFFINDRSDVIFSCGGGETMCEDLAGVDFEAISGAEPKWFMGFSDNTNLTFTLPVLADTAAIYGSCAAAFGRKWYRDAEDCLDLVCGKKLSFKNYDRWESGSPEDAGPLDPYNLTMENSTYVVLPDGKTEAGFSGRMLGGCLDCLQVLCGTKYDKVKEFNRRYASDGVIWFLEACDLNPMEVWRALWQLDSAGWFETAKGFITGRPRLYDFEECCGMTKENAVTDVLGRHGVPIVMDADLGHLPPAMPFISGALADVKAGYRKLEISYRLK